MKLNHKQKTKGLEKMQRQEKGIKYTIGKMHKYKIVNFVKVQLTIVPIDRQTSLKLDTLGGVKA